MNAFLSTQRHRKKNAFFVRFCELKKISLSPRIAIFHYRVARESDGGLGRDGTYGYPLLSRHPRWSDTLVTDWKAASFRSHFKKKMPKKSTFQQSSIVVERVCRFSFEFVVRDFIVHDRVLDLSISLYNKKCDRKNTCFTQKKRKIKIERNFKLRRSIDRLFDEQVVHFLNGPLSR